MKRVAVLLLLALPACGGTEPMTRAEAPATSRASVPVETQEPSRCLPVDPALLNLIASAAEDGVGTLTFTRGAAVRSDEFSEVYMVAGEFTAPGFEDEPEIGVWSTNSLTPGGGLTQAVDGFAQQFTILPDADKTQAQITQATDGVDEARGCLS